MEGGAAAAALGGIFGSTTPVFSCHQHQQAGGERATGHASFSQAADENALSRIYIGYHFRKSIVDGKALKASIGAYVAATAMPALHAGGRQRGYEKLTKRRRDGDVPLTKRTGRGPRGSLGQRRAGLASAKASGAGPG